MTHCKHFVVRKKRFCRMTVKAGEEYCGEHQIDNQTLAEKGGCKEVKLSEIRITCPLDPKHTCYASKLNKHLKICNAKQSITPSYIEKSVNLEEKVNTMKPTRSLSNVSTSYLLEVINRVNKIYDDIIKDSIQEKLSSHSILKNELSKANYGNSTKKHLLQTSSIIGLLNDYKLLRDNTCYVEFGAGKGKLSYWISKTLEELSYTTSSVLLIERASHRHKYDNKLDKTTNEVVRIRADIADLILSKINVVQSAKHVIGVTKHLCGEATDLAIRCLANCQNAGKDVYGMLMAFCCHHRCQWSTYVGKDFFTMVGLSSSDFDVMCGLVSWAVCGSGQSREYRNRLNSATADPVERNDEIKLSRQEKEEIGKKCKLILDFGRKFYAEKFNFKCDLCYYVNNDISPENVCIVSVKDAASINL